MSQQIYRDLPVDCFACDNWNTVEVDYNVQRDSMEDDQDESECAAGGFSYQRFSHRFILWRINGRTLELVEYSTEDNLSDNALRLQFSEPLVSQICFVEEIASGNPSVYMFAITTQNQLFRFNFSHPSIIPRRV